MLQDSSLHPIHLEGVEAAAAVLDSKPKPSDAADSLMPSELALKTFNQD